MPSGTLKSEYLDRLKKSQEINSMGFLAYPSVSINKVDIEIALGNFEKFISSQKLINLAGRILTLRIHGGSLFLNLQDNTGEIQVFIKRDLVGEEKYHFFKQFIDPADYISVDGTLFLTKTGEKTLLASNFSLLTKTLRPLPEKWHGLTDIETRYRKRYLDLLVNPESKIIFIKRSKIFDLLRNFLHEKGYLEVETPILQNLYGGGYAKPFITHHNILNIPLFLRISDELYLKRLIVGGMEKIFEFCKDFRNEGIDHKHNPEFSMLEIMTAFKDYRYSMELVEEIYEFLLTNLEKRNELDYQGKKIDFKRPWKRITLVEAVKNETGIDYYDLKDLNEAKKKAIALGIDEGKIQIMRSVGELVFLVFEEKVEKTLWEPTIIYDYPVETSPLAKVKKEDPRFVERFEHFIAGMEQGNHYSELNDPEELKKRFIEEKNKEKMGFDEAQQTDEDFIEAMEHGMPPTTGIGIGLDRLVMLFTNSKSLKEVILFPTMKPKLK